MNNKLCSLLIILIIIAMFSNSIAYSTPVDEIYLDIRLTRPLVDKRMINLESSDGFAILDNNKNLLYFIDEIKISAYLDNGNINLIADNGNTLFTLPNDGNVLISSVNTNNSVIKIERDRYRDFLRLISRSNEIIVINHVKIENYLYGVVPSEMGYNFHKEALKAQAVASRSFTLSNTKHIADGYNLCDSTHCQVYSGLDGEHSNTNLAVDETRGILALYDGRAIEAIYHSTSSGMTEDSVNVWGGNLPYLKSVVDRYSTDSPYSDWSFSISINDLNNKIISSGITIGELKNIEILETTPTGNVKRVKLIGTYGEEIITGSRFRTIIGVTTLKSTWFSINNGNISSSNKEVFVVDGNSNVNKVINLNNAYILDGKTGKTPTRSSTVRRVLGRDGYISVGESRPVFSGSIIIEGKGYGHGVGMSQNGARKMGELGFTFDEILKHYYTDIDVY